MDKCLKKRNAGSSLIFVIVAVAFVSILATIVLRVTLINIDTKSIDRSVKKNFYTTEKVMDEVNLAVQNLSQECLKEAYVDILKEYTQDAIYSSGKTAVQTKFTNAYLRYLIRKLSVSNPPADMDDNGVMTIGAQYDVEVIRTAMGAAGFGANSSCLLDNAANQSNMELVYTGDSDSYLLLKGVNVEYKEGTDVDTQRSTKITTDIKLQVPELNFEGGSIYPDFTKYCIIGDERVNAKDGVQSSYATGNIYAGEYGLNVSGGSSKNTDTATLTVGGSSSNVITRGDISVARSGNLLLGSQSNPITVWTENYKAVSVPNMSGDSEATLEVHGTSYVHDDLSLDAPYSSVTFADGNYYGYSFNKDNTKDSKTEVNSQYSSAIVINGRNSALSMQDTMSSILLGGRAFISREKQKMITGDSDTSKDIMLGESISVKSNQSFYLVANEYLSDGYTNPISISKYRDLQNANKPVMTSSAVRSMRSYLDQTNPVTAYFYDLNGTSLDAAYVYFYYNFKNQSAANKYFQSLEEKEIKEKIVDTGYLRFGSGDLSGISISSNLTLFTAGNYFDFSNPNQTSTSTMHNATITSDNENFYKNDSVNMAAEYKSYQLNLADSETQKYNFSGRSEGDDGFDLIDKKLNRIFDKLMTKEDTGEYSFVEHASKANHSDYGFEVLQDAGRNGVYIKSVAVNTVGSTNVYAVFVADTETNFAVASDVVHTETSLSLANILQKAGVASGSTAIVVSNCNVKVDCEMSGLVISRHTVSYEGSNRGVKADSASLQAMFAAQKSREGNLGDEKEKFLKYFVVFSKLNLGADTNQSNVDYLDISSYVKYVNWQKNNE